MVEEEAQIEETLGVCRFCAAPAIFGPNSHICQRCGVALRAMRDVGPYALDRVVEAIRRERDLNELVEPW